MKRLLLAIAVITTVTPVAVQAHYNDDAQQEQSSCHRCARRASRCRTCEGRWHPLRGSCERCNRFGCDRNA